jgi:hypothetical protein
MKKFFPLTTIILFLMQINLFAQDIEQILKELTDNSPNYTFGTFKGTTIINGQSIEVPGKNDLRFVISHRFGEITQGIYSMFGLDQGTTRLGFEYGINDIASISIGRNTFDKIYDGSVKLRVLRQQTGLKNIPVSVTLYASTYVKTLKWEIPERDNLFSSRISYVTQVLVARKFNQKLSIQISPSYIHKNLVPTPEDQNNIFAVGLGGRYKLGKKFSLNGEYYYLLPGKTADDYINSLSIGFDLESAGHVFQLHVTNSQLMFARGFITETTGDWTEGEIYFGFNIYRVFTLGNKSKKRTRTET